MSENPFIRRSDKLSDGLHQWQAEEGETDTTMLTVALEANTETNAGIAFELRLVALALFLEHADGDEYETVRNKIKERIGLP